MTKFISGVCQSFGIVFHRYLHVSQREEEISAWGWGTKLDQELYYGKAYIISKEVLSIEHRRHC